MERGLLVDTWHLVSCKTAQKTGSWSYDVIYTILLPSSVCVPGESHAFNTLTGYKCRTKEALSDAQGATRAAELALQSAQATAALSQERLQLKEEQLTRWMTLEEERKQVMKQREEQLQELSQVRGAEVKAWSNNGGNGSV